MPVCPKCKTEYSRKDGKCINCGEVIMEPEDIVEFLITAADEIQAAVLEARLNQYGIPVMKKYREAGSYLNVYMGNTVYGIDIYVPSDLLTEAERIIETDDDELKNEDFAEVNDKKTLFGNPWIKRALIGFILLGMFPGVVRVAIIIYEILVGNY
ncbi:MAG TPA: DUF2007 domain-containing protein [Clostridia bacterium]